MAEGEIESSFYMQRDYIEYTSGILWRKLEHQK
jgi:hypothetical protein